MLVEFKRKDGGLISINADAVAWAMPVLCNPEGVTPESATAICISGKEGDVILVEMQYRLVVEQLQDAMS